jgi:chromosome segregation ATPase
MAQVTILQSEHDNLKAKTTYYRKEILDLKALVETLTADKERKAKQIEELRKDLEAQKLQSAEKDKMILQSITKLKAEEEKLSSTRVEVNNLKSQTKALRDLVDERNAKIDSLSMQLKSKEKETGKVDVSSQVKMLEEEKRDLQKRIDQFQVDFGVIKREKEVITKDKEVLEQEIRVIKGNLSAGQQKNATLIRELDDSTAQANKYFEIKSKYEAKEKKEQELQTKITTQASEIIAANKNASKYEVECEKLQKDLEIQKAKINKLESAAQKEKIVEIVVTDEVATRKNIELQDRIDELKQEIEQLNESFEELHAEKEKSETMCKDFERKDTASAETLKSLEEKTKDLLKFATQTREEE